MNTMIFFSAEATQSPGDGDDGLRRLAQREARAAYYRSRRVGATLTDGRGHHDYYRICRQDCTAAAERNIALRFLLRDFFDRCDDDRHFMAVSNTPIDFGASYFIIEKYFARCALDDERNERFISAMLRAKKL